MALRVNREAPLSARQADPQELEARAEAALARGDLKAFAGIATAGGELEDPLARYSARTLVLERGLAAVQTVARDRVAPLLHTIAVVASEALEAEPREPVLLNYLGVALYELGALDAAENLFRGTLRLEPRMVLAHHNLQQVAARRRRRADVRKTLPPAIRAALPGLERSADRYAAAAHPVEGQRLSLCMIVRDEEEMLPRCLASVRDHVDEIVIVDTGSVDRTIEIARSFGARVVEQPWTGSFADARNRSFDEATGDWLMFLDADEVVVAEDAPLLREITGRVWREAFDLVEISFTGDLEDGTAVTHNALRIFRNRPQYRFEGRLHEQIASRLPALPERIESVPIRIEHYGYLGRVRDAKAKSQRNVELLEQQMADGVDSAFLHFNLGSEYGVVGDAIAALEHFRTAWRMVCEERGPANYGFTPSLCARLVKALRITGDHAGAIRQAEEGLRVFPGFTDLILEQGLCERARGNDERARALFERCLETGDAPANYTATLGAGSFLALMALADCHREAGDNTAAERLLLRCLSEHPGFLGVVLPLADVMLARGADPAEVVRAIADGVQDLTPSVRFVLGVALYEAGAVDAAEPQFRAVVDKQPSSAPARLAFAEALLSQLRYAEAAQVAAGVEHDSPWAPAALTNELVARLLEGDTSAAHHTLDAAAEILPEGQRALFGAWLAALEGGQAPAELPLASAGVLFTVLEALLRLREVEAFGLLAGLADRVGLPWREVREVLASIYLRRGFLESAADEWIEVCRQGPDVRALTGLAQVAYARGMHEDARMFALEAHALDPAHPAAGRLAQALSV